MATVPLHLLSFASSEALELGIENSTDGGVLGSNSCDLSLGLVDFGSCGRDSCGSGALGITGVTLRGGCGSDIMIGTGVVLRDSGCMITVGVGGDGVRDSVRTIIVGWEAVIGGAGAYPIGPGCPCMYDLEVSVGCS